VSIKEIKKKLNQLENTLNIIDNKELTKLYETKEELIQKQKPISQILKKKKNSIEVWEHLNWIISLIWIIGTVVVFGYSFIKMISFETIVAGDIWLVVITLLIVPLWLIITSSISKKVNELTNLLQPIQKQNRNIQVELDRLNSTIGRTQDRYREIKRNIEQTKKLLDFEISMKQKGLKKFVDRFGKVQWGKPKQVKQWEKIDFVSAQMEKGLVLYDNQWITPYQMEQAIIKKKEEKFEEDQKKKGLVKFVNRYNKSKWGSPKQVIKWKKLDMDMDNHFADLTPWEFERLINNLFLSMGYDSKITQLVADYGADIVAEKDNEIIAVQVKRYNPNSKVGSPEVQIVLGSMFKYNANKAILVTSSYFTKAAKTQAFGAPIELWDYQTLCRKIDKYLLKAE
jgi:restriction system protein